MLKKLFRNINHTKLAMILGGAFTISPMLSSGYDIQPAFLALFDLSSTTLYKSVHGECIYRLPSLAIWFKQAFHPIFLFVSVLIAMFAFRVHSLRKLFYAFWFASVIGLCGLDLVFVLFSEESLTITYVIQNFVSNIIGSFVLALVLAIIMFALEYFFQLSKIGNLWKYITCTIGGASIGSAISTIVYFILGMFLHPAHVDARILTTHTVSGRIATQNSISPHAHPVSDTTTKDLSTSEKPDDEPFSLIPRDAKLQRLELQLGHDNSGFRWTKMQDDTTFSLSIYAFSGCVNYSELDDALSDKEIFFQDNIRDVRFLGDGNMQEILIDGQQSDFVIFNKKPISFTLKEGTTDSLLDISQFLADANLQAKTSGDISIKLTRWLLNRGEEKSRFI